MKPNTYEMHSRLGAGGHRTDVYLLYLGVIRESM